jgi:glutathione synthase/RimK-type ligase-like ATP-grasp enzyme
MHKTLIVVDDLNELPELAHLDLISFDRYLRDFPKRDEPRTRIINLCDTQQYLSKGYYCSLLAEARKHKVLPSVKTINQLREEGGEDEDQELMFVGQLVLDKDTPASQVPETLTLFFGAADAPGMEKLARRLFERFPAPILKVILTVANDSVRVKVRYSSYASLDEAERVRFIEALTRFTDLVWRTPSQRKSYRWEMAILVNPEEELPPSDRDAIARFVKAAKKLNIYAQPVSSQQLVQLSQFDALFIRETTAIAHPTYRIARKAENLGLVVMDDPDSILRCCNKVFLHDAFSYQNVPSPLTSVVMNADPSTIDDIEQRFGYPVVLKMPEGSFSSGVFKASDRAELDARLRELFQHSALVLVQEYLYTDFDWRIGVLNGRAIYACKYMMVRNHWQIYNKEGKRYVSGGFETLPTFEVPKAVLDAAVKAANVVGKGLYGVDLKQKNHQVYVIEVNDNPSIDHEVEDAYLGDELYMLIMAEFQRRLELRGR